MLHIVVCVCRIMATCHCTGILIFASGPLSDPSLCRLLMSETTNKEFPCKLALQKAIWANIPRRFILFGRGILLQQQFCLIYPPFQLNIFGYCQFPFKPLCSGSPLSPSGHFSTCPVRTGVSQLPKRKGSAQGNQFILIIQLNVPLPIHFYTHSASNPLGYPSGQLTGPQIFDYTLYSSQEVLFLNLDSPLLTQFHFWRYSNSEPRKQLKRHYECQSLRITVNTYNCYCHLAARSRRTSRTRKYLNSVYFRPPNPPVEPEEPPATVQHVETELQSR